MQLEFVTSAASVASQRGYALLLWTSETEDEEILRIIQQGLVEGVILMEIRLHDPRVQLLQDLAYPFSMIGRCEVNEGINFVDADFNEGARLCVHHLANLGHRQIALIGLSQTQLDSGYGPVVRFLEGFQAAIEERGLQGIVRNCEATTEAGWHAMRGLREEHPVLSAALVSNDRTCTGVMQALAESGIQIPRDFSIVAKVPPRAAEIATPPLTSIEVPTADMGRIGMQVLISQLEGADSPVHEILPVTLTVRQSTSTYSSR
jgi:DNA-binding LacI/PurR family transcriptional regulator